MHDSQDAVQCDDTCELWFHIQCVRLSKQDYALLKEHENLKWTCGRAIECKSASKPDKTSKVNQDENQDLKQMIGTLLQKVNSLEKNVQEWRQQEQHQFEEVKKSVDFMSSFMDEMKPKIEETAKETQRLKHANAALEKKQRC